MPQAVKLIVKVLSKTMDSTTLSSDKVELATLSRSGGDGAGGKVVYKVYEDSELKPLLDAVNVEQAKEKEKEK